MNVPASRSNAPFPSNATGEKSYEALSSCCFANNILVFGLFVPLLAKLTSDTSMVTQSGDTNAACPLAPAHKPVKGLCALGTQMQKDGYATPKGLAPARVAF